MTDDQLTTWVDGISLDLLGLEELEEPGGLRLDFSAGSLAKLEARLGEYGDLDTPEQSDIADGAAGYLGEMLLRLAGGAWDWREDEPVVLADKVIGVAPVYPRRVIAEAMHDAGGRILTTVYATWEQAVARHRATDDTWEPRKKRTPGVDPFEMTEADAAYIAAWVSERKNGFGAWCAALGAEADWDFGPESLDILENRLSQRITTSRELYAAQNRDLVDGAVWYFGEAVRRIRGGAWVYRSDDPASPGNVYAGDPYVQQAGPDGDIVMPILTIDEFVATGERGTLRARYERSKRDDGTP